MALLMLSVAGSCVAAAVDWPSFLSRSDPVNAFDTAHEATVPDVWLEGSFAGNGMLGAQVLVCPGGVCRQVSCCPAAMPLQAAQLTLPSPIGSRCCSGSTRRGRRRRRTGSSCRSFAAT